MKLELSDGREFEVEIRHTEEPLVPSPATTVPDWENCLVPHFRTTRVTLSRNHWQLSARAVCKDGDNFSKREGRRRAANRLLSYLREIFPGQFTSEDRSKIFRAICPEYFPRVQTALPSPA